MEQGVKGSLTIEVLQAISARRSIRWHEGGVSDWSLLEWAGAMCGEAGEAADVAKKIKRLAGRNGPAADEEGNTLLLQLGDELADVLCYAVLVAERAEIDLAQAVRRKFNLVSARQGFPERL